MNLSSFLAAETITADAITAWNQRGIDDPANALDKITARCAFLRDHLATHVKANPIPGDAEIKVARVKIGDLGLGETITVNGLTFAAVAGAFRIVDGETITAVTTPKKERPIKSAARPVNDASYTSREIQEATPASERHGWTNYGLLDAISKAYEDAADIPFTPESDGADA